MSAVCPICCEEIVEATQTSQVKRPFCVMAPAQNGSIKDYSQFFTATSNKGTNMQSSWSSIDIQFVDIRHCCENSHSCSVFSSVPFRLSSASTVHRINPSLNFPSNPLLRVSALCTHDPRGIAEYSK